MTNKKKNINELVTDDDDPTAELEALVLDEPALLQRVDIESDAGTYDFPETENVVDGGSETISELKSDLETRSKTIDRLQFDIEQLRAKWLGLEAEIAAREVITERLNLESEEAKQLNERIETQLKKRDRSIKSLKAETRQRDAEFRDLQSSNLELHSKIDIATASAERLEKALKISQDESSDFETQLQQLREKHASTSDLGKTIQLEAAEVRESLSEANQTIAELEHYINGRRDAWEALHAKLAERDAAALAASAEQESVLAELERRSEEIQRLCSTIDERDIANRKLRDDIEALERERDARKDDGLDSLKRTLTEQAGQLASSAMTVHDLRTQIDRTETYADTLRRQLQDFIGQVKTSGDTQNHLQLSLHESNAQQSGLREALEIEKQSVAALKLELDNAIESHAIEIRTIRFELGEAEETLAQNESVSEQLVSDLVDTREFRNQLEIMLEEKDKQSQLEIGNLMKRIRKMERTIATYEQKLESKNEAVNCLIAELAKKDKEMESIDQIEEVIQEIDDRMSERIEERQPGDRDRITRVLIGSIDGQELRFPLFKNRLTIGRTRQNDIHIEAPYISRRHAVIVTDGNTARIVDWGSKNGVSVNSQRITEHFLKNGDVVTIGTAEFKYEERPKRDS